MCVHDSGWQRRESQLDGVTEIFFEIQIMLPIMSRTIIIIFSPMIIHLFATADRLAQLVEYRTTVREVVGSNPGRTNTQGL